MTEKKLKGIRAIAFDLDGTLTDSAVGLTEATNYALLLCQRCHRYFIKRGT